jgi:hypothetical protein
VRILAMLVLAACGEDVPPRDLHYELGVCGVVDIHERQAGPHVPQGSPIEFTTNPPNSGPHFGIWAQYDRTYTSLERGYWMHNAEHGAVVLAYRCDAGCDPQIAQLEDAVRAFPDDASCEAPVRHRALVVNDPLLPDGVPFAAIAWGVTYSASCVDPEAIATFHRDFYARAPEDLCAPGASLGGTPIE